MWKSPGWRRPGELWGCHVPHMSVGNLEKTVIQEHKGYVCPPVSVEVEPRSGPRWGGDVGRARPCGAVMREVG